MTSAAYHFIPWVRQGMPAGITSSDPLGAGMPARASIPVTVQLSSRAPGSEPTADTISMPLRLYGPGDVIGIDPREIIRTEPPNLTQDFPPHLMAAIEFDRPDFPWLFTPAAPNDDRLRPWIALVVVSKAAATLSYHAGRPLPTLTCPAVELPDLTDSWKWAHAQFLGAETTGDLPSAMAASQPQTVSRLLCPRRLCAGEGSHTDYLACLVPAFDLGRLAGLGETSPDAASSTLSPAWDVADTGSITLPVYYSWEFGTSPNEGDFEELVDRLQFPGADDMPAPGLVDMSRPGRDVLRVDGATLGLRSALRPPGATPSAWPSGLGKTYEEFQSSLEAAVAKANGQDNLVSPPVYGALHALGADIEAGNRLESPEYPWLKELNRDPRYRVAAALGAQVVREQQEQLISSAWKQAGQVAEANRWLAQKQLAREVTHSIHAKRIKVLSPGSLQQITAAVAAPAPVAPGNRSTPRADANLVIESHDTLLDAIVSAPFRRIVRPESPIARHPTETTSDEQSIAGIEGTIGALLTQVVESPTLMEQQLMPVQDRDPLRPLQVATPPTVTTLSPASATAELLNRLNPNLTYTMEAAARIETTELAVAPTSMAEPLAPLRVAPTFPQPMYEPLRDMFRDMLLPGLDGIRNNSVMLLETDPAFIEAYMAGLNDEMSRELLWREFPADLRGTYFRQFWDVRSHLHADSSDVEREALLDIPPILDWKNKPLGDNIKPERGKNLVVLLIKGDLLIRFPTAVIFAIPARWSTRDAMPTGPAVVDDAMEPVFPSLLVEPVPGVRLLGFDIEGGAKAAVGGTNPTEAPGWFIVIQEHPTEPRFGLNVSRVDELNTWRKLAWSDVALREKSAYIDPTSKPVLNGSVPAGDANAEWGRTGAAMAYITLQKAYRLEVHAGHWLS
jgi:hypothetical protein